MKYGARNAISGKVVEVKQGDIMSKVTLETASNERVSSVMTAESLEELDLKEGDQVKAVIKAVNVLLVKES